jgi:DnaJ-class molecular chaperone
LHPRLALPEARRVAVFSRELQMTKTDAQGVKTGTSPTGSAALNPGDEAAPGTTGTGEDVCPDCQGKGRIDGAPCATCGGSGTVIRAVGGA